MWRDMFKVWVLGLRFLWLIRDGVKLRVIIVIIYVLKGIEVFIIFKIMFKKNYICKMKNVLGNKELGVVKLVGLIFNYGK